MDRGKRKMTAEKYEQDRIARKRANGPPPGEGLRRLQPMTPIQLRSVCIDLGAGREELRRPQPQTPMSNYGAAGEELRRPQPQTPDTNSGPTYEPVSCCFKRWRVSDGKARLHGKPSLHNTLSAKF